MRLELSLHPDFTCGAVTKIEVEVARTGSSELAFRYLVTGSIGDLCLLARAVPERADGLWQHTCFEAFLRHENGAYYEFNFAPSTEWAAYAFDGYRSGMRNMDTEPPRIGVRPSAEALELQVKLEIAQEMPRQLALSAVIEEKSGRKSYWALRHPAGKADFHHPESFACELP